MPSLGCHNTKMAHQVYALGVHSMPAAMKGPKMEDKAPYAIGLSKLVL